MVQKGFPTLLLILQAFDVEESIPHPLHLPGQLNAQAILEGAGYSVDAGLHLLRESSAQILVMSHSTRAVCRSTG